MPTVTVEGPVVESLDTKRTLVKEMTAAASKAYGLPEKIIVVLIKENPPENVGTGGQLLIDRHQ